MPHRYVYRRVKSFVVHHILHTDDTPSRIARAVAIGIFIAWLPLIGLQMLLVLTLSFIFRANKIVGLPLVWISNPFTLGPVYYPSYLLGSAMLKSPAVNMESLEQRFAHFSSLSWSLRFRECADLLFSDIFYPTLIGSVFVGAVLALASYFLTIRAVKRHRLLRIARRARRLSKLAEQITPAPPQQDNQTSAQTDKPKSKAG